MTVQFLGGKKSKHSFMPVVTVTDPDDWDYYEERRPEYINRHWRIMAQCIGKYMTLLKHHNTMKAICRWVQKNNFKPGTVIIARNWYVGYAYLVITV